MRWICALFLASGIAFGQAADTSQSHSATSLFAARVASHRSPVISARRESGAGCGKSDRRLRGCPCFRGCSGCHVSHAE